MIDCVSLDISYTNHSFTSNNSNKQQKPRTHTVNWHCPSIRYETLVGNLLYIDIPGGRDVNRSWQNFLSQDEMDWGFPYFKGSKERPRATQPEPYLAHQVGRLSFFCWLTIVVVTVKHTGYLTDLSTVSLKISGQPLRQRFAVRPLMVFSLPWPGGGKTLEIPEGALDQNQHRRAGHVFSLTVWSNNQEMTLVESSMKHSSKAPNINCRSNGRKNK